MFVNFSRVITALIFIVFSVTSSAANQQSLSEEEVKLVGIIKADLPKTLTELEQAVNINSGTMNFSGVKKVGQLMINQLNEMGFDSQWYDGSAFNRAGHVVARYNSDNPQAKKILMIGHLDTVFAKNDNFQQLTKISTNKVAGPGITDMKGGNAIIIATLRALKKANLLKDLSIEVVMTGDEESSGRPLSLSKKVIIDGAKWADIAIGFEDGDGDVKTAVVARRGAIGWTLTISGKPAHSSQIFRDDIGYGAIYEAARILTAFRTELAHEKNLTFNPGMISGGTTVEHDKNQSKAKAFGKSNVIAQKAVVSGDIRGISQLQVVKAKQVMQQIVNNNLAHTKAILTFAEGYPPMAPTQGNYDLLSMYNKASVDLGYDEVTAVNPRKAGAADISFAADYVDMALDGMGLMGSGGHTKDEVADMSSLQKNIEKAAILLFRLSQPSN